jgi:hypothetical protein
MATSEVLLDATVQLVHESRCPGMGAKAVDGGGNRERYRVNGQPLDLLYCVEGDVKDQTKFRYTQAARHKETKVKKYRDYLHERKQEPVDRKRVVEWEAEMSSFNRKTTDFTKFKAYIQKTNELNARLARVLQRVSESSSSVATCGARSPRPRLLSRFKKLFRRARDDHNRDRATSSSASTASSRNRSKGEGLPGPATGCNEFRTSCRVQDVPGVRETPRPAVSCAMDS